jgi:hypothetical protein
VCRAACIDIAPGGAVTGHLKIVSGLAAGRGEQEEEAAFRGWSLAKLGIFSDLRVTSIIFIGLFAIRWQLS